MTSEQRQLITRKLEATTAVLDATGGTREQQLEAIVRSLAVHLQCILAIEKVMDVVLGDLVLSSRALAETALEFVDEKQDVH